jgi:hypothetical protein
MRHYSHHNFTYYSAKTQTDSFDDFDSKAVVALNQAFPIEMKSL